MRKQQRMVLEERSERIRKLHDIQKKYNIHLKTKVTETGEEIICLEIPFEQKMRNECNDYHYFFQYKRDRCPILQEKDKSGRQFESGHAKRLLSEFEAQEVLRREKADFDMQRTLALERELLAEKAQGRTGDVLTKMKTIGKKSSSMMGGKTPLIGISAPPLSPGPGAALQRITSPQAI